MDVIPPIGLNPILGLSKYALFVFTFPEVSIPCRRPPPGFIIPPKSTFSFANVSSPFIVSLPFCILS